MHKLAALTDPASPLFSPHESQRRPSAGTPLSSARRFLVRLLNSPCSCPCLGPLTCDVRLSSHGCPSQQLLGRLPPHPLFQMLVKARHESHGLLWPSFLHASAPANRWQCLGTSLSFSLPCCRYLGEAWAHSCTQSSPMSMWHLPCVVPVGPLASHMVRWQLMSVIRQLCLHFFMQA